jgi:hypothetical protein
VLCLHGYDDPMAQPDSMQAVAAELSDAGADWQIHAYGGTQHAFSNPQANDPEMGTIYSPVADARATRAIENFLAELFPACGDTRACLGAISSQTKRSLCYKRRFLSGADSGWILTGSR